MGGPVTGSPIRINHGRDFNAENGIIGTNQRFPPSPYRMFKPPQSFSLTDRPVVLTFSREVWGGSDVQRGIHICMNHQPALRALEPLAHTITPAPAPAARFRRMGWIDIYYRDPPFLCPSLYKPQQCGKRSVFEGEFTRVPGDAILEIRGSEELFELDTCAGRFRKPDDLPRDPVK